MQKEREQNDENFLKEFLKEFYRQIMINIENYTNFEIILIKWTREFFHLNKKDPKIFLKLMEEHEENENWFSSLIGFFYEYYIVDEIFEKPSTLKFYLSSINKYYFI
ncbi:unnamed protein product [Rhizophagus irregularis]|nr:unnamed protein product [Rhizophagus irregularis]